MNVIARLTSTPTASSRVTSFTLHDPSDKPVTGQQSRPLLGPTPLHIPRLLVPRNLSEPTSSNRTFMIHAFYCTKASFCVGLKLNAVAPPSLSNATVSFRLSLSSHSQRPQPSSTRGISARVAASTDIREYLQPLARSLSRTLLHNIRAKICKDLKKPLRLDRSWMWILHLSLSTSLSRERESEFTMYCTSQKL